MIYNVFLSMSNPNDPFEPILFQPVIGGEGLLDVIERCGKAFENIAGVTVFNSPSSDELQGSNGSVESQAAKVLILSRIGLYATFGVQSKTSKIDKAVADPDVQKAVIEGIDGGQPLSLTASSASCGTDQIRGVSYVALGFNQRSRARLYGRRLNAMESFAGATGFRVWRKSESDPLPALALIEFSTPSRDADELQRIRRGASAASTTLNLSLSRKPLEVTTGPARFSEPIALNT